MPPPLDEHAGLWAVFGTAATGVVVVVIKWLFATRRDLRVDSAESGAAHVYRDNIEHQAARIEYLEAMLDRRDKRIAELERSAEEQKERIERLIRMKD